MAKYYERYNSPLGEIIIIADETALTGLCFHGQRYYPADLPECEQKQTDVIKRTIGLLNRYFQGEEVAFDIPLKLEGTDFRKRVWQILLSIPYGKTMMYGDIAKILAEEMGLNKMSAQAVGGAVGHNNIAIIVPCHRVIASNGNIGGFGAGIDKKEKLLKIEKII